MDAKDFATGTPGTLLPLGRDQGYAFLPADLPPRLEPSFDLMRAAEDARGAVGELTGQARLVENVELIVGALARREAVLSSRIEGTQTRMLDLLERGADRASVPEDSDDREVLNYLETIFLGAAWLGDGRRLGIPFICDLHTRLLQGVRGDEKDPGVIRSTNVFIGSRTAGFASARFVPPPAEHVIPLLEGLERFIDAPAYGPLIAAAIAHYQFEAAHPFLDGNGRLGRLLVPLQLMQWELLDRPLIYLGWYTEAHAEAYRDHLLAVSQRGAWAEWISFFLEAIEATAIDARNRVARILSLQARYRSQVTERASSKFSLPAVDVVLDEVVITTSGLAERLGTTRPTARQVINDLGNLEILQPHTRARGTSRWIARELLEQVYED